MAKGLRSNAKKRWRALKRQIVLEKKVIPTTEQLNQKLQCTIQGVEYRQPEPPNAFLKPKDPNAVFPQIVPMKSIDFRSTHVETADQFQGAYRKKKRQQAEEEKFEFIENPDFVETSGSGEELIDQLQNWDISEQKKPKRKNKKSESEMMIEPIQQTKKISKKQSKRCKKSKNTLVF